MRASGIVRWLGCAAMGLAAHCGSGATTASSIAPGEGGSATEGGSAAEGGSSAEGGTIGDDAAVPEAAVLVDEPAVMAMSAGYAMLNKVNRTAFTSLAGQAPHGGDPLVDVYVNSSGVAVYGGVDPSTTFPAGPFPTATLIVKYNEAASPFLTVMYKAAPGYDYGHGDWWYGRLNTDGTSTGYTGRVSFCVDCHGVRASQDYAYGVALDNR